MRIMAGQLSIMHACKCLLVRVCVCVYIYMQIIDRMDRWTGIQRSARLRYRCADTIREFFFACLVYVLLKNAAALHCDTICVSFLVLFW